METADERVAAAGNRIDHGLHGTKRLLLLLSWL